MGSLSARLSRYNTIAFIRRFTLLTVATVALTAPGLGDDQKPDKVVTRGQVMCALTLYLRAQMITAHCGFARRPIDDAIDDAVAEIEEFALANFPSDHVTRSKLEEGKRIAKETPLFDPAHKKNLCEEGGSAYFLKDIRDRDPDQFRKEVKELLSRPLGPPGGIFSCR